MYFTFRHGKKLWGGTGPRSESPSQNRRKIPHDAQPIGRAEEFSVIKNNSMKTI